MADRSRWRMCSGMMPSIINTSTGKSPQKTTWFMVNSSSNKAVADNSVHGHKLRNVWNKQSCEIKQSCSTSKGASIKYTPWLRRPASNRVLRCNSEADHTHLDDKLSELQRWDDLVDNPQAFRVWQHGVILAGNIEILRTSRPEENIHDCGSYRHHTDNTGSFPSNSEFHANQRSSDRFYFLERSANLFASSTLFLVRWTKFYLTVDQCVAWKYG